MERFKHKKYIAESFEDSFDRDETDYTEVMNNTDEDAFNKKRIIDWICNNVGVGKYTVVLLGSKIKKNPEMIKLTWINDTYYVDIFVDDTDTDDSIVHIIRNLPEYINFGTIHGHVYSGKNVTTLRGFPIKIDGDFDCYDSQLTSLEGCPEEVGGDFGCYNNNKLTSLKGCPKKVGGNFDCEYNQLKSLEGCPEEVGGHFDCVHNQLKSLEGCPKKVGGYFTCCNNQLTSLEGCPEEVGGHFDCEHNQLNLAIWTKKKIRSICKVGDEICNGVQKPIDESFSDISDSSKVSESFEDSFDQDETDYTDVLSSDDNRTRKQQIIAWLSKWDINYRYNSRKYTINDDWTVDVDGNVNLSYLDRSEHSNISGIDSIHKLTEIGIQFGIVKGSFNCSYNELTSLKGCPKTLYGDFDCSHNKLTSLEYSPQPPDPKKYDYYFAYNCSNNNLKTLKGFSKSFIGDFDCSNNNLESLKFGPTICYRGYGCANNFLTSLKYAPKEIINGGFDCSDNNLTSLEHCPNVGVNYYITVENNRLVDLTGCPKQFGGIECSGNPLKSLKGAPKYFNEYPMWHAVPIAPGYSSCKIPGIKFMNDFVDKVWYEENWAKMNDSHVSESFEDSFDQDETDYTEVMISRDSDSWKKWAREQIDNNWYNAINVSGKCDDCFSQFNIHYHIFPQGAMEIFLKEYGKNIGLNHSYSFENLMGSKYIENKKPWLGGEDSSTICDEIWKEMTELYGKDILNSCNTYVEVGPCGFDNLYDYKYEPYLCIHNSKYIKCFINVDIDPGIANSNDNTKSVKTSTCIIDINGYKCIACNVKTKSGIFMPHEALEYIKNVVGHDVTTWEISGLVPSFIMFGNDILYPEHIPCFKEYRPED